jgi:ABC-type phosphate transport system substrate-binding protein
MKVSITGATFLLVSASTAAVFAVTSGDNLVLNGSDTLFEVTQDVLTRCDGMTMGLGNSQGHGLDYEGGGSGVGENQMSTGAQEISPMSRALGNVFCGKSVGGTDVTTTAQDMMIGLDGIAIVANQTTSCLGNGVAQTTNFPVFAGGATAPICATFTSQTTCTNAGCTWDTVGLTCGVGTAVNNCTGCGSGTNTYTFADSLDALKIIYGGRTHDGTVNCASDVRKSLVNSWHSLFQSACADTHCVALTHAWRRADLSGTTDAFQGLVGIKSGSFAIGTLPTCKLPPTTTGQKGCVPQLTGVGTNVPSSSAQQSVSKNESRTTNPFCNSPDLQVSPFAFSNGGKSDYADSDPIRTKCTSRDDICAADGKLGLVTVVLQSDVANIQPSDNYPTHICQSGAFELVDPNMGTAAFCPAGPLFLGKCFEPYYLDSMGNHAYDCMSSAGFASFGAPSSTDGRVYNTMFKKADTLGHPAAILKDSNQNFMTGTYYRIHQNHASTTANACSAFTGTGSSTDITNCTSHPGCTWNTTTVTCTGNWPTCTAASDTEEIGCLVNADPCSIGYAGREAVPSSGALNQALLVNGISPTDANVAKLLTGGAKYPLSRRLFFASLLGFPAVPGGEKQMAMCFGNNPGIETIMTGRHFVPLSPLVDSALTGVQCLNPGDAGGPAICCQGTPAACSSNTTQATCVADTGCAWDSVMLACSGTGDCTKNTTSATCTGDTGCAVTNLSSTNATGGNCATIDIISGAP